MRILGISGSLRQVSHNRAALEAVATLAPADVEIVLYQSLGDLPLYNFDLDTQSPPVGVGELRRLVGLSDGLLIASPEYAHGIAGPMKNALDWLVGSAEFPEKPVALMNTSPRATHAQEQIREVLKTMSASIIEEASFSLPLLGTALDASAIARSPELSDRICEALLHLKNSLGEHTGSREQGPHIL